MIKQRPVYASIITIGDELLIGQVIDTNSAWMAEELNKLGIWVKRRVAIGDNAADIQNSLDEEMTHSDIILITGGLGPTADDITKPVLSNYFGGAMVVDEGSLSHIKNLYEKVFRRPFTDANTRQAEIPDSCTVLPNRIGTAPGMLFEKSGKVFISMPGVPLEMKGLMQSSVLPLLKERFISETILHRTLLTAEVGESILAEYIHQWETSLPEFIKLAYLPNYGLVRLRLTAAGRDKEFIEHRINEEFEKLKVLVAQWLVTDEDLSMPQMVGRMLKQRKKFVGTAESCTGGYIAHLLTRESGASDNFKGTIVSYANQAKEDILGVDHDTIQTVGAVSEDTVRQMVAGAIKVLKTDYAIATSGIMGPDGGTPGKPVGTVWVAAGNANNIKTRRFHFRYDRMHNIELTAVNALNLLRKFILEEQG